MRMMRLGATGLALALALVATASANAQVCQLCDTSDELEIGDTADVQSSRGAAIGYNTIVSGFGATALGVSSEAMGDYSTALGYDSLAYGDYSMAAGDSLAYGDFSVSAGFTTAIGNYSTAFGVDSVAVGVASFAAGDACEAGGLNSVAIGINTEASGDHSVAIGTNDTAEGLNSVAMGVLAEAVGADAVAIGDRVRAQAYGSTAMGRCNVEAGTPTSWVAGEQLFAIGNGTPYQTGCTERKNAFTVLKNGKTGINTATPEYPLHVKGGSDAALGSGGYVVIGSTGGTNIAIDSNEIMARNNGGTATLYLNHDGGSIRSGSTILVSSDRRLKQDIELLGYGLEEIMRLESVSYHWKRDPNGARMVGFLAQDVQDVLPELVRTDEERDGTLSVDYMGVVPVLVNAVQELGKENAALKATVAHLGPTSEVQGDQITALEATVSHQDEVIAELQASLEQQQRALTALAKTVETLSR